MKNPYFSKSEISLFCLTESESDNVSSWARPVAQQLSLQSHTGGFNAMFTCNSRNLPNRLQHLSQFPFIYLNIQQNEKDLGIEKIFREMNKRQKKYS